MGAVEAQADKFLNQMQANFTRLDAEGRNQPFRNRRDIQHVKHCGVRAVPNLRSAFSGPVIE